MGQVTTEMLRELFNAVLSNMVPDPVAAPPVLEVKGDPTGRGRFAFVEFRTSALAAAALHLDKVRFVRLKHCAIQLHSAMIGAKRTLAVFSLVTSSR